MRSLLVIVVVLLGGVAAAQPVSYQLRGDVPVGERPQIKVTATQAVTNLVIEVARNDGKKFTQKQASLAKGKSVTFDVGDGAAGKASYKGTISAKAGAEKWSNELVFDTMVRAPIKVAYDADHLDLDKRILQFKPSRGVVSADLVVIGDDGKEIGTGSATYKGETDTWLSITWTQPKDTRVMMLKLHVEADDESATNLELIPWSVAIEHEDVNFSTDSAVIEKTEEGKLDASLVKIGEAIKKSERFIKMTLYVAGHTDTVGASAKNKKLSLDRARAIAAYFRKKGLKLPIAFAGFGEEVLKVKTADNTDERANRRADYVLGPTGGAPPFKGPYLKVKADWKHVR
jgi:outer membrane protein OmpA-like peptidoglycan-associated protein